MAELITALRYIKFVIKLLLFLILLPLTIICFIIKFSIYKFELKRNLMESGMPKDAAEEFTQNVKFNMFI